MYWNDRAGDGGVSRHEDSTMSTLAAGSALTGWGIMDDSAYDCVSSSQRNFCVAVRVRTASVGLTPRVGRFGFAIYNGIVSCPTCT